MDGDYSGHSKFLYGRDIRAGIEEEIKKALFIYIKKWQRGIKAPQPPPLPRCCFCGMGLYEDQLWAVLRMQIETTQEWL